MHSAPKNPKALIPLVRVSTYAQGQQDTQQIQIEGIRAHALRLGVVLNDEDFVTLIDVSGNDVAATDEWQHKVLPRLRNDPDAHLIVWHQDRLIRAENLKDFGALVDVQETGKIIYHPGGSYDLADPEHRFLCQILAAAAGLEKTRIKLRTHEGKRRLKRLGQWTSGKANLPTGLDYDRDRKPAFFYTPEITKVQEAYRLVAGGLSNLSEVARRIGAKNTAVQKWLRDPVYRGEWRSDEAYTTTTERGRKKKHVAPKPAEQVIVARYYGGPGQEPQAVSDEQWYEVQRVLGSIAHKVKKIRATTALQTPYSGLCYSGHEPINLDLSAPRKHVLYAMRASTPGHADRYYCSCSISSKSALTPCGLRSLRAPDLTAALDEALQRTLEDPYLSTRIREAAQEANGNHRNGHNLEIIESQLRAVQAKLDRLSDLYIDGRVTKEKYTQRFDALTQEQQKLDKERQNAEEQRRPTVSMTAVDAFLSRLHYSPTMVNRREWLTTHVAGIYVSNDGLGMVTLRLPAELRLSSNDTSWTWEDLLGYDIHDRRGRTRAQGRYTTADIIEALGITVERYKALKHAGVMPLPKEKRKGWTAEDYQASIDAYRRAEAEGTMPTTWTKKTKQG